MSRPPNPLMALIRPISGFEGLPGGNHPKHRKMRRKSFLLEQLWRELGEQADREADHVGDASLEPLDQGRAQRLDRIAAGAATPLAEAHVALLLGLLERPEDDRRPFQAAAL